jgi:hypothetical protein
VFFIAPDSRRLYIPPPPNWKFFRAAAAIPGGISSDEVMPLESGHCIPAAFPAIWKGDPIGFI